MKNRVTDIVGSRYPIIQGGMTKVGVAELVAAISNAGAFGLLTALTQPSPEHLAKEIARCREMTDQPFGVNLTILPSINTPPYHEYLEAAIAGGIKVLETAGSNPKPFVDIAKAAGMRVIHKCCSVQHAIKAEQMGVDIISIDGFECAGHPGNDDIGGLVLVRATVAKVSIPVIASGGIADGNGMAAALALGAEGINMGTRFVVTQEAPIHEAIKQAYVDADEKQTQIVFRTLHNTARVFKNDISVAVVKAEGEGCIFADIQHLVAGVRGAQALDKGDPQDGMLWASQAVGLIRDIPSCEQLISRMMRECNDSLAASLARIA